MIKPFENLDIVRTAIKSGLAVGSGEVKFVKPSKPIHWEYTMQKCILMCKILKTLNTRFNFERNSYHFKYIVKTFYNSTTFSVKYISDSYTFEVKTGPFG